MTRVRPVCVCGALVGGNKKQVPVQWTVSAVQCSRPWSVVSCGATDATSFM